MSIIESARPQYGKGSNFNVFQDMLARDRGGSEGDEARSRLAASQGALDVEKRTSNIEASLSHQGSDFAGPGPSAHLNDAFVDSATREIVIAPLFRRDELPANCGDVLKVPRLSASITPTAQLDAATVATANPTTAAVSIPVATVSALLTVSRQWMDMVLAPGGETIAAEILGRRFAEAVDLQLYAGSGSSGQTTGLRATASPTTASYTDASPTVPEFVTATMKLRSTTSTARKAKLDTAILHPSIASWLYDDFLSAGVNLDALKRSGLNAVEYSGVSVALGAGTESEVLLCRSSDLRYWSSAPELTVAEDYSGVTSGSVAIAVHGYVASPGGNLNPLGIGLLSGTGLAAQSGY